MRKYKSKLGHIGETKDFSNIIGVHQSFTLSFFLVCRGGPR